MSQVMEFPNSNGGQPNRLTEAASNLEADAGFDILKVLWRWKWLPILGAILGTGLGYLFYAKQPPQYIALALVQVVEPLTPAGRFQVYDPNEYGDISRSDESLVIRSQAVMRLAVEGSKQLQDAMDNEPVDQIVGQLLADENLVVQPAAKDSKTTLIEISYVCDDAERSSLVVNAIVDGYGSYLANEYQNVGDQVAELLQGATQKLTDSFDELAKQNNAFKASNENVVWTGDKANDPHAESYAVTQEELSNLRIQKNRLASVLEQATLAINAGRRPEQILLMLSSESESNVIDSVFMNPVRQSSDLVRPITNRAALESERLKQQQLFPLQLRERELLDSVGAGHPSLLTLQRTISLVKEEITRLEAEERVEREELEKEQLRVIEEMNKRSDGPKFSVEDLLNIRVASFQERLQALSIQEAALAEQAEYELKESHKLQQLLADKQLIDSKMQSIKVLLDAYTEKLAAISLQPNAGERSLKTLNLPSNGSFYGPKLLPYLLGGAGIGFILLSGMAVLMDLADRSYRSPEEIAADLGMPVLGHVPVMDIAKVKKTIEAVDPSLSTIHHSRGRVSESFRAIRTGLFFSNRGSELKVIQVTSPVPGDGKSTLSANLAVTMAQSGRRVLLIDADFRRPRIAKLFGIDAKVGMAQAVAGKAEIDDATYTSHVANLSIMPGGSRPNNPAELLSSHRFQDTMDILRGKYDIIVVDTPPLLAVSDPGAVAAVVDGVVLTMRLRRNVKPLATRATKILESVDARLLGVVVNGVSAEAGYGYSYSYNDYRYAYRYGGNYRYGYGQGYSYGGYSAGYIDERPEPNGAAVQESGSADKFDDGN